MNKQQIKRLITILLRIALEIISKSSDKINNLAQTLRSTRPHRDNLQKKNKNEKI